MTSAPFSIARLAAAALITVGLACSDGPLVPTPGAVYRLRSINGRPLPTTYSSLPPTDSFYYTRSAEQYRILSDTVILHDAFIEATQLNPDGSITHPAWGCWENYPYRYRRSGDSLQLTPLVPLQGPPTPPMLRLRSDYVLELSADAQGPIRLRFEPAGAIAAFCPEVVRADQAPSTTPQYFQSR